MEANGVNAIGEIRRTVPDLIVTDLNMPDMTEIELSSLVRRRYPAILIVAMSGDDQEEVVPGSVCAHRFYPKGQHPHKLLTPS